MYDPFDYGLDDAARVFKQHSNLLAFVVPPYREGVRFTVYTRDMRYFYRSTHEQASALAAELSQEQISVLASPEAHAAMDRRLDEVIAIGATI